MDPELVLTRFLLELSARADAEGLDPRTLRLHVRRADMADYLGLEAEALERAFEDLVSRGFIGVELMDTVTILDHTALERAFPPRSPSAAAPPATSRERTERALKAILGDERFLATPRTSALLVHLVERALAGETDRVDPPRLAAVLGETPDGAPGTDPADPTLRVLLTRLRRMLDDYAARTPDAGVSIRLEEGVCRVRIESRKCEEGC